MHDGDVHHVGMLQHRVEAGLARHLLEVHGRRPPKLGQLLVLGPVDERAGVSEVDVDGAQSTRTLGRGKPSASAPKASASAPKPAASAAR